MRPRRDADRVRLSDHFPKSIARRRQAVHRLRARNRRNVNGEHALERAARIEHLDAPVRPVADVDVVLIVDRDRVRYMELAWLRPEFAPLPYPVAVFVELRD